MGDMDDADMSGGDMDDANTDGGDMDDADMDDMNGGNADMDGGAYRRASTALGLRYRLRRDRRPFNRGEVLRLPEGRCGVYAVWLPTGIDDAPAPLYVGKSEVCLRRRLLQHLSREKNAALRRDLRAFRDALEFSVAYTASLSETDALETALIRALQPAANVNKR